MVRFGVVALMILPLMPAEAALADSRIDYAGELDVDIGGVSSSLAKLPPWALVPWTFSSPPDVVGRFGGRADLAPTYSTGGADWGLRLGIYSNEETDGYGSRGVVPIDTFNPRWTRTEPQTPLDFDHLALFYAGAYGQVELGWGTGISERTAIVGPHDYGLGGIAGDYIYFLDNPHGAAFNSISALGSANPSPRALYLSPRIAGLEAGVSFQPDTRDTGFDFRYGGTEMGILGRGPTSTGTYEGATAGFTNVVEAGLNYDRKLGEVRMQASLAGIDGQAVPSPTGARFYDLRSYQAGAQFTYGSWSVGAGIVMAGPSGITVAYQKPKRLQQYTLAGGAQYVHDKWTFGFGTLHATDPYDPTFRSDRQMHVYSLGLRYKFNEHVDVGAEIDHVQTESATYGDYSNYLGLLRLRYLFDGQLAASK